MSLNTIFPAPAAPFMPHDEPMALIDTVLECRPSYIKTQVEITPASLFLRNNTVPAWVGIEYMAQTAAAWSGVISNNAGQMVAKPPIGYLLGTRHYSAHCSGFNIGDILHIHAKCLLHSADGLGSFECRIERDGETVALATLSVFQPK